MRITTMFSIRCFQLDFFLEFMIRSREMMTMSRLIQCVIISQGCKGNVSDNLNWEQSTYTFVETLGKMEF
jgi:hypothetical protein